MGCKTLVNNKRLRGFLVTNFNCYVNYFFSHLKVLNFEIRLILCVGILKLQLVNMYDNFCNNLSIKSCNYISLWIVDLETINQPCY